MTTVQLNAIANRLRYMDHTKTGDWQFRTADPPGDGYCMPGPGEQRCNLCELPSEDGIAMVIWRAGKDRYTGVPDIQICTSCLSQYQTLDGLEAFTGRI